MRLKNKKDILIILFIFITIGLVLYTQLSKDDKLPRQYKDYEILDKKEVFLYYGLDNLHNKKTQLFVINNRKDYDTVLGLSKIILVREDGYFLELPGYGEGFQWWEVGDFNKNADLNIAVMYQNMGSGSFDPFYFYQWNGYNFDVKINNHNLFNDDKLVDLDHDGIMEVLHTFRSFRMEEPDDLCKETYVWNRENGEFEKKDYSCIRREI
ncbi:hypothetical protein KJ885_01860 [Patescibacteria group bacterium]|nr:hypothetical protein [Patescibacteria group bacterium]